MTDALRTKTFLARPMVMGFLSTLLEDLQLSENEEACTEEREARDTGTIYSCPDSTFRAAVAECDAFESACRNAPVSRNGQSVDIGTLCRESLFYVKARIGSDLYLERAGHGAGFRDRDIWSDDREENKAIGEALSDVVSGTGLETYLGDDGEAYICGSENA